MQRMVLLTWACVCSHINKGSWVVKYSKTFNQNSSVSHSPLILCGCWYFLWFPAHEGMSDGAVTKLNVMAKSLTWNQEDHWAISSLSRQNVLQINSVYVSNGSLQTLSHLSSQPDWAYLGSSMSAMANYHIRRDRQHIPCYCLWGASKAMWQTYQWWILTISAYCTNTIYTHMCLFRAVMFLPFFN